MLVHAVGASHTLLVSRGTKEHILLYLALENVKSFTKDFRLLIDLLHGLGWYLGAGLVILLVCVSVHRILLFELVQGGTPSHIIQTILLVFMLF